ncbi:MAG TPA: phosphopantetheine-binding protein [Thermoanaerobaculia bacterium]|nr:phosphopantetheine-binding protein [Thermoanaerobaculia bacterium]
MADERPEALDRDRLQARIFAAIARSREIPVSDISPDASFEDLGLDSLDGIEIVFVLEEEFDISIPDEAARHVHSLRELVDNLYALLSGSTPDVAAKLHEAAG